jgi:hypothetical protein
VDCRPKKVAQLIRYPLDFLIVKGSKQFCEKIFDKSPQSLVKSRPPQCHWCMSAVSVFDIALKDRGQEDVNNLTTEFCPKTGVHAPHLLPYCEPLINRWSRAQTGDFSNQASDICNHACASPERDET